jgi:hypothetical protein
VSVRALDHATAISSDILHPRDITVTIHVPRTSSCLIASIGRDDRHISAKAAILVSNVIQASRSPPAFRALHPPHKGPYPISDRSVCRLSLLHHSIALFSCTKEIRFSGPRLQALDRNVLSSNHARTWPLTASCTTVLHFGDIAIQHPEGIVFVKIGHAEANCETLVILLSFSEFVMACIIIQNKYIQLHGIAFMYRRDCGEGDL